jgi:hypothetical protein
VLFGQMPQYEVTKEPRLPGHHPWAAFDLTWAPASNERALLILELPGVTSVHLGLALAGLGYRPIPLFNACTGPNAVIEQEPIQKALQDGAAYLRALALPADAPPAFLLDRFRQTPQRPIRPGAYDNRWRLYPEDFPSEELLLAKGFTEAVLVRPETGQLQDDLASVLWNWQEAGLRILGKNLGDAGGLQRLRVPRPPWFSLLWQNCLVRLGWRRSPAGGFGYIIPEPSHG